MTRKSTTRTAGISKTKPMTVADAARIQSTTAKVNGGKVHKSSFPARAMRSATKAAKRP